MSKLFGYDFDVEYRLGRLYTVADVLSRRGEEDAALGALTMPSFRLFDDIRGEL